MQDWDGARLLLENLPMGWRLRLQKIWAAVSYKGDLIAWCWEQWEILLEIVSPSPTQKVFASLPKRWIVERNFAWLGHSHRLSKDYEACLRSIEGMIYIASIHALLNRLAP